MTCPKCGGEGSAEATAAAIRDYVDWRLAAFAREKGIDDPGYGGYIEREIDAAKLASFGTLVERLTAADSR